MSKCRMDERKMLQAETLHPFVMAGLDPAIHVFFASARQERRGCPASQASLRGLRKADRYGRA